MRIQLVPVERPISDELQRAADEGYSTDLGWWEARVDTRRYSVLRSRDAIAGDPTSEPSEVCDWRWHISVAGESDVPRWRDLVAIGHELRPGVCFVVGVPPRCLHLWESKDANLMDQWMAERTGSVPS